MATEKNLSGLVHVLLIFLCISTVCISSLMASQPPVRLALILSQTGIAAQENIPAIKAAELAIEEINARGGLIGHPVELMIIDNKSTPLGSKAAALSAVDLGVIGVIGAFRSSHSLPVAMVMQAAKIPMITPSSTDPEITLVGDYIFRACFMDSFQGRIMARFAYNDLGAGTAVILTNASEAYSLSLADFFDEGFAGQGGRVLWEGSYNGTAVDFKELLSQVKILSPDVVFVPGYSRDSGLLISQAEKMEIQTVFLGGDAWGNQIADYAGDSLRGSYYSAHWHQDTPFERNKHLKRMFAKKYNISSIDNARIPLTYDALWLMAKAVIDAGSIKKDRIRDALSRTRGFQGATGIISFDHNGDPFNKEASILKFEERAWKFIKSEHPM